MRHPLISAPYRRKRRRGQWLGAIALLGACAQSREEAGLTHSSPTVVDHNDGTAERLPIGAPVRFPGVLHLDFERGAWIGNFLTPVPAPDAPAAPVNPDFICADLQIDVDRWGRLWPLSTRPVTVFGTVASRPESGPCPIYLTNVQVVRR
jgi:hypothetical protein